MLVRIFSWVGVVLWMLLIFYFSHQPATESSEISRGVSEIIIDVVQMAAPMLEVDLHSFNHYVRKNAHFLVYLALGLLLMNALRRSGIVLVKSVVLALGIGVIYAISDEVHQLFIPGRSGEVRDVLIDSAGAAVGIGIYVIGILLSKKINKKKKVAEL